MSVTLAPSKASSTAEARPMPWVLPQTMAVLVVRSRFKGVYEFKVYEFKVYE
jgi:hypothetical protein